MSTGHNYTQQRFGTRVILMFAYSLRRRSNIKTTIIMSNGTLKQDLVKISSLLESDNKQTHVNVTLMWAHCLSRCPTLKQHWAHGTYASFLLHDIIRVFVGEATRLVAWLVKNSRHQPVMKCLAVQGALPHLVNMTNSEFPVMQNEALLALTLITTFILGRFEG